MTKTNLFVEGRIRRPISVHFTKCGIGTVCPVCSPCFKCAHGLTVRFSDHGLHIIPSLCLVMFHKSIYSQ
ncbi:hypothetical protein DPMN_165992 [Dreissena polymorpha]|uniref:Uncharacterized protein n=1 Tax=Dreissena polymorpha TaxID=45954 RepID=A0A9D4EY12_DREPO|nr:hypothetical protein DPMN_165992 [Dreissena polymorpha]